MSGARQIIAVIIPFRKSNKNSLERQAGANGPSRKKKPPYVTFMMMLQTNQEELIITKAASFKHSCFS